MQLVFGDSGAQWCDGGGETGLGQRDDIHVAFCDDERCSLASGFSGGAVVVKTAAFVKELGFRRVQVFRVVTWVHRATTEGNCSATSVADREHDAVSEGVVGARALVGRLGKTGV